MQSDFNEALCVKFAAELVDMVTRVKQNREVVSAPYDQSLLPPVVPNDVQYFIHSSGLKEFYKQCQDDFTLYLPLSVGQPYHEGAHAASQVACLKNIRDGYEAWLQDKISQHTSKIEKIKRVWPVVLIVADTAQALNKFPQVNIDFDLEAGQCLALIKNEKLRDLEQPYVEKGLQLERIYADLFLCDDKVKFHDVEVDLCLKKNSIRWGDFSKKISDPEFIEMINYLERCFKMGLQIILEKNRDNKLPFEVKKLFKNGIFDSWANNVFVNDLCYVLCEIVFLHCAILNNKQLSVERENNFLLYPGPLNMILLSGKNMLAIRYSKNMSQSNCTYLRFDKIDFSLEKQDKNGIIFAGRLSEMGSRVLHDDELLRARKKYIQSEINEIEALKITLHAMNNIINKDKEKNRRRQKRKAKQFETSPYASFLNDFDSHYVLISPLIKQLCASRLIPHNHNDLGESIVDCLNSFLIQDQNSDSPKLLRSSSGGFSDEFFVGLVKSLLDKIIVLREKMLATDSNTKLQNYWQRIASAIVLSATQMQSHFGGIHLHFKKSKSVLLEAQSCTPLSFFPPSQNQSQTEAASAFPVYMLTRNERLLCSFFYFIQRILDKSGLNLRDLNNPSFYPDVVPEIEYRSTQESLSGSTPGSLSQSQ